MNGKTRLPFAPAAVRDALKADADFTAVVPAEFITTRRVPQDLSRPYVTCRSAGTMGKDPMLQHPLVQIDVWVPDRPALTWPVTGDPEEVAWDIAGLAGEVVGRTRNRPFRNCAFSGHWKDGPHNMIDTTRGVDLMLFRAPIRVELTMRMDTAPTFAWE